LDYDEYAPSFDDARNTLASMLDGWVFGRVMREVKRPDICKPYFHGMIVTSKKERIWFQQSNRARTSLQIGPITIQPSDEVPHAGDVLMGRMDTSTQGERHKSRLMSWYTHTQQLQMLTKVCLEGTHKHEMQLMSEMRTPSNDDVWALCRLVLFGNIRAFADAHRGKRSGIMKLSTTPLEFVYSTAETLGDETIWDAFLTLVPDAQIPSSPRCESPPFSSPMSPIRPSTPPFTPLIPSYNPTSPPPSPPPSPPYNPTSPPYNPTSPPYNPTSPPYNPTSPPPSPSPISIPPPALPMCPPLLSIPTTTDSDEDLNKKAEDVSKMLDLLNSYAFPGVNPTPQPYDPLNPAYDSRL
jgi:hypothetical protein